jgi:glycosyltransferase involved in cell wall biosynthesis
MAPEQVVILSVARLEALKGLELVPELARRLADLPCVFLILGEGPQRPVLEQRVRALGLEQRVRLLGDVRDPSPYFRRADVYLHPSRYESFGMALFEAMQHGVAPLCGAPTRRTVVATPEFLEDRREGRLVDLDDPEAVAQALREWIERPEERRAVGRAAAERARRFLAADYAERVERLAQALLDEGGRPR